MDLHDSKSSEKNFIGGYRVLFLDIDGVLNSKESFQANHAARLEERAAREGSVEFDLQFSWPLGHLSPPLVERLNTIVEKTGCEIVLSSTWRKICCLSDLRGWLEKKGFRYPDSLVSKTATSFSFESRGEEIQDWLDTHPKAFSYAIVDDDSADIVGDRTNVKHPDNFVQTDYTFGLQDAQVEKIINLLNNPKYGNHC